MQNTGWPTAVFLFSVASLVAQTASGAAPQGNRVAIHEFAARGVSPEIAANVADVVAASLVRLGQYAVISPKDIEAMVGLQARKQLLGCDNADCMTQIGRLLGGSGAGGSVYLNVSGSITGAGSVQANGGNANSPWAEGGGGGGRVALVGYTSLDPAMRLLATGGYRETTSNLQRNGGAGTVFYKGTADAHGYLEVSNAQPSRVVKVSGYTTYLPSFGEAMIDDIVYDAVDDTTTITHYGANYPTGGTDGAIDPANIYTDAVPLASQQINDNNSTGVVRVQSSTTPGVIERV